MEKFAWYMISTVTGKEDLVVEALKNRIISEQVEDCFDNTATPEGAFKIFKKPSLTAKEAEKKRAGENYKIKYINMYSGYIFIKMIMTDKAWFVIRNTTYVTGLIGSSGKGAKPTPVSQAQINKCFLKEEKVQNDFDKGISLTKFTAGEIVEITDGPFKGESGKVLEANDSRQRVTVELEYCGKKVPTDFEYNLVKSIDK
ncbi:transcription termination/antitermination protein NusG [Mycoplasma sp. Mirounga ES2805-ORL]|uniref:transcription termination/antitermination protein NusG n=1 Tax=Mycoplasma sp. Mirounga ES2805-ORL TaxID=754514 RepID=UPI00197BFAAF|nr:transcription termination/antitermination protein NusG [Mycoplasma sp. Mirounga ES2805-ORL]QSF13519.1 transcription termination/antitermination protein NusG [Mycoplasma sp. Mirounga ES2805-ORL]